MEIKNNNMKKTLITLIISLFSLSSMAMPGPCDNPNPPPGCGGGGPCAGQNPPSWCGNTGVPMDSEIGYWVVMVLGLGCGIYIIKKQYTTQ